MKEGTKYWLKKFLQNQASYYQSQIDKTMKSNKSTKEEKLLSTADINGLRLDQEFKSYKHLKWVYEKQGVQSIKQAFHDNKLSENAFSTSLMDYFNQINSW